MNRTAKIAFQVIGVVAILCAFFGLRYNAVTLASSFPDALPAAELRRDPPYFYPVFYLMSAICIGCYALLLVFGFQFIRGRSFHVRRFTALLLFEIAYSFALGMLWFAPIIGTSVAAATGVAIGGMMVQFHILFPLWGPLLAFWAKRRLHESTNVA